MNTFELKKFIVYIPFVFILIGFILPIKPESYSAQTLSQSLLDIQNLHINDIKPQKAYQHEHAKEIFLITKNSKMLENGFGIPQLTIISKDKYGYFCFLNGNLYREGDSGPDFKVLKIAYDYVILQTPIGRQTIYVKIP